MIKPEIHLADLIRALRVMTPDEEARKQIASMLGFEFVPAISKPVPPPDSILPKQVREPAQAKTKSQRSKLREEGTIGFTVDVIEESVPVKVPALQLPEAFQEKSEEDEPAPTFFPLLAPLWTRAIITKMLSVETSDGPPDIAKLIEIISSNQPLKQIPRLSSPTLRQGVQVLIDRGPGLVPYQRDQVFLLEQLDLLAGRDQVHVWEFVGTPLKQADAVSQPRLSCYRLPPPGTPILMLTDLGVAAPPFEVEVATPEEWLEFVQYVRQAKYQLLVLTPYHPIRCPNALKDDVRIIQWDRETSVSTVLRALS